VEDGRLKMKNIEHPTPNFEHRMESREQREKLKCGKLKF